MRLDTVSDADIRATRKVLKTFSRVKLRGRGRFRSFCAYDAAQKKVGRKYAGLTKRLDARIFSKAKLPISRGKHVRKTARERRRYAGARAGRLRGIDVDRELTKLANGKVGKMAAPRNYHRLTRLAVAALHRDGLRMASAQHPVVHAARGVASAADLLCLRECDDDPTQLELVIVEVKTGYDDKRMDVCRKNGGAIHMKAPLHRVGDSWCHRHLAQLAATWRMFVQDEALMAALRDTARVRDVSGMLLYLTERDVEAIALPEWWAHVSSDLLAHL